MGKSKKIPAAGSEKTLQRFVRRRPTVVSGSPKDTPGTSTVADNKPGSLPETAVPLEVHSRFIEKLQDQLRFLELSCRAYDEGLEPEALQIAIGLRTLLHRTADHVPLVGHLKPIEVGMLSSKTGLANFSGIVRIQITLGGALPFAAMPSLGDQFTPMSLAQWWHEQIVFRFHDRLYSRRELVLAAADFDPAGMHQEKLHPLYEDLASALGSMGLNAESVEPLAPPPFEPRHIRYCGKIHLAMVRQIGHEVLASAEHFNWIERWCSKHGIPVSERPKML